MQHPFPPSLRNYCSILLEIKTSIWNKTYWERKGKRMSQGHCSFCVVMAQKKRILSLRTGTETFTDETTWCLRLPQNTLGEVSGCGDRARHLWLWKPEGWEHGRQWFYSTSFSPSLKFFIIERFFLPWLMWLSLWVPACEPKGCWFNSQSGHMPGLWTRFPSRGRVRGNQTLMFLLLSPFLPLSDK